MSRKREILGGRTGRLVGAATFSILLGPLGGTAWAQGESVISTVHNLSASGPGPIRAVDETQVCRFCHIPHNADIPKPLWGRRLSLARYSTPRVGRSRGAGEEAPQPDGTSRLCMSCHDGTIALGEVLGRSVPIAMAGSGRLQPGDRGFLGTDLSGSHPVSIVVAEGVPDKNRAVESDMVVRQVELIAEDPDVKLDADGKMQCTACHDPHSDRYYVEGKVPRFWVKPTVDEVCLTCHVLR